jgi:ATP-binding cassette subfamily B protein
MNSTEKTISFQGFFAEAGLVFRSGRTVWSMVPRKQKLAFAAATVLLTIVSGCNIAFPLLLGDLVDGVKNAAGADKDEILRSAAVILGWIAGIYVARELIQVGRRALVESACTRFEQRLSVMVIGKLIKSDLAHLSKEKIGTLQGRIGRSVVGTVRFVRLILLDCLPPFVTGGFAIAAALSKKPILAVAMAGVIPISIWLTVRQLASQKGIRLRLIGGREKIDGSISELLGGIDYVRAAHTENYELKRFDDETKSLRSMERRHHLEMSLFGAARALNEGFFHILVLGLGVYLAVDGQITYGDILTFSMLFLTVMAPMNEVHRALDEGHECSLEVANLQSMLDQPQDRSFNPDHTESPVLEKGEPLISCEELVLDYPTEAGSSKRALDKISMCIRHGETIGIAGPSGCGKTTLLRVLMRLTHPSSGQVRVGRAALDQLSRADIGSLIGYVGQNPFIIHGTIAENITYGIPDATPEMVEVAARLACIHDEIVENPKGYMARVLDRGSNLSGGQRQRIALARVFLKDPPILILDEGTSALDSINERQIKKAIEYARQDRTVVLVAHRLTTLKDADRILVFQTGKIVEEGTYSDLASRGGVFTELIHSAEMVA